MNYDPAYGFNKFKALMDNPQQSSQNPMAVFSALMGRMAPQAAQRMDGGQFPGLGGQFPGLGGLFGQRPQTGGQMPLPYAPQQTGQPMAGGPMPPPYAPQQPGQPMTGGQMPLPMSSGLTPFDDREPFKDFYRQSSYGGGGGPDDGDNRGYGSRGYGSRQGYGGGGGYLGRALYGGGGGMGGEGAGGGNALDRKFGLRGSGY